MRSFRISNDAPSFTIVDGGAAQLALGGLLIAGMLAATLFVAFHM